MARTIHKCVVMLYVPIQLPRLRILIFCKFGSVPDMHFFRHALSLLLYYGKFAKNPYLLRSFLTKFFYVICKSGRNKIDLITVSCDSSQASKLDLLLRNCQDGTTKQSADCAESVNSSGCDRGCGTFQSNVPINLSLAIGLFGHFVKNPLTGFLGVLTLKWGQYI